MVKECMKKCSNCGHNRHNSRSCSFKKNKETCVKIFGVNINVVPEKQHESSTSSSASSSMMRKAKSTPNLVACNPDHNHDDGGYVSDHGSAIKKKGVPWTEKEHLSFLSGLEKLGKGDWKGISRNYVHSRTATQVASHAQKYFKRLKLTDKTKRRSSLFDMSLNEPEIQKTPSPESTPDNKIQKLAHKIPVFTQNQYDSSEEQVNTLVKADATPVLAAPNITYTSCYGGPSLSDTTSLTSTPNLTYTSCYGGPNFSQMQYIQMMGMTTNGQIIPGGKSFSAVPSVPMLCIPNTGYYCLPKSPGSQTSNTFLMTTFPHGSSSHMARH